MLFEAIKNQNIEQVAQQLRQMPYSNQNVNQFDNNGWTALHWAAWIGNVIILEMLLDCKPQWTATKQKESPLHLALSQLHRNPQAQYRQRIVEVLKIYYTSCKTPVEIPTSSPKPGCPQRFLNTKLETLEETEQNRIPVRTNKVFALLTHRSRKTNRLKASLKLDEIHHQLREVSSQMGVQQTGNIVVAAISFEIKINADGQSPFFVTFPIKVPGKTIYSHSDAVSDIGTEEQTRNVLKELYSYGRRLHLDANQTHGHQPKYDGSKGDAQYVNHSEQSMYAYLSTTDCANMLVQRLITTLRGKDLVAFGKQIKVYSATLHLHSSKTPCGACEYVMVGAQSHDSPIGLMKNLTAIFSEKTQPYTFVLPQTNIGIFSTYTANQNDKDHRKLPTTQAANWRDFIPTEIETRARALTLPYPTPISSLFVYAANFGGKELHQHLKKDFSEWTVFSSASKANRDVQKREQKFQDEQDEGFEELRLNMQYFSIAERQTPSVTTPRLLRR